jgi:glycerophosphoryl diester phosphodiesterase
MLGRNGKIIVAHRGASAYEKENTLRAFERAIELGADVIEFDVRKTADHVLIVHHDEKIRGKMIRELSYADVGRLAGRGGFHIPMLEEVLIFTRGKIGLNAELKEQGYEEDVAALMGAFLDDSDFVLSSFNEASVEFIKCRYPAIKAGLVLGKNFHRDIGRVKADFWVPNWRLLDETLFSMAEQQEKPLVVWTLNDRRKLKRYISDPRICGVITDRPDLAVSVRRECLLF